MATEKNYWFPTKRYGWGWGCPSAWQGRAVMIAFFALVFGGAPFFLPAQPIGYVIYTLLLSAILVAICWFKGEPPTWRWGER